MNNKNVDPGWNDPPMLNYSPENPPPKSRIGNKRVAFPVGPTSSHASAQLVGNDFSEVSSDVLNDEIPSMKYEGTTFSNFDELMKLSSNNSVQQKIEIMKDLWRNGQFSCGIKKDIYELSDCLVKKDFDKANKLHLKILMNNPSECKAWISAMQYFISNISK